MRRVGTWLAVGWLAFAGARGATYHVDGGSKACSDRGACTSAAKPCCTIGGGVSKVSRRGSDVVVVAAGTYRERVVLPPGGGGGKPTLRGAGIDRTFVECTGTTALDDAAFVPCSSAANDCDGSGGGSETFPGLFRIPFKGPVHGVFETNWTPLRIEDVPGRACTDSSCTGTVYDLTTPVSYTEIVGGSSQAEKALHASRLSGSYFTARGFLFVHPWDDGNPATAGKNLEVAVRPQGIAGDDADGWTIEGLTVQYCGTGIDLKRADGVVLRNVKSQSAVAVGISNAEANDVTLEGVVAQNVQVRGQCDSKRYCRDGVEKVYTQAQGWSPQGKGDCWNAGGLSTGNRNLHVSRSLFQNCWNATQSQAYDGVVFTESMFRNAPNHLVVLRPANDREPTNKTCRNILIDRSIFYNAQEAIYVSSCTDVTVRRSILDGGPGTNEYRNPTTGWRMCGNLFHKMRYKVRMATSDSAPFLSDHNWFGVPEKGACRFDRQSTSCVKRPGPANDWNDLSGQDAHGLEAPFSLAKIAFPWNGYTLEASTATASDFFPTPSTRVVVDAGGDDVNCDGKVDATDVCDASNHCFGKSYDLGPFELGIDTPR